MRLSKKSFIKRQNQALRFEDKPRSSESPRRNQGHQHWPCTGGNASAIDTPWVLHIIRARVLAHSSTADPPFNSARSEILISYASRRATPRPNARNVRQKLLRRSGHRLLYFLGHPMQVFHFAPNRSPQSDGQKSPPWRLRPPLKRSA